MTRKHDIGPHRCDFCWGNRLSSIKFKDYHICKACHSKATRQKRRIEKQWSAFLDKTVGTSFLLGSDDALLTLGGCSRLRPDKIYTGPELVEIDECDEHQHATGNYPCEDKRLSEIYDEEAIRGKRMVVLRWNPHAYKPPKGQKKKTLSERLLLHAQLKLYLRDHPPKDLISIYYLFYDKTNPVISRAFPTRFIYDLSDFM
jgi:hypothetical protein